jgi:hypothetical protein
VLQRRDRTGLTLKTLARPWQLSQLRSQYLDGDIAIKARIARFVDLAHAAGPEDGLDFVRTEPGTGFEHHSPCRLEL